MTNYERITSLPRKELAWVLLNDVTSDSTGGVHGCALCVYKNWKCVLDKIQRLIDAEGNCHDENGNYLSYAQERVNSYEAMQWFVESDFLCPSVNPQNDKLEKITELVKHYHDYDNIGIWKLREILNGDNDQ